MPEGPKQPYVFAMPGVGDGDVEGQVRNGANMSERSSAGIANSDTEAAIVVNSAAIAKVPEGRSSGLEFAARRDNSTLVDVGSDGKIWRCGCWTVKRRD